MKKFLSLILTLAMVLSLVTVPAMADTAAASGATINKSTLTLKKGDSTENTLAVTTDSITVGAQSITPTTTTYAWTSSNTTVATVAGTDGTGTITANKAGTATISCKVTFTYGTNETAEQTLTCELTVYDCDEGITALTVNGGSYAVTDKKATVYYVEGNALPTEGWAATTATGYTATYSGNDYGFASNQFKASVQYGATTAEDVVITITGTKTEISSVTRTDSLGESCVNHPMQFKANATGIHTGTKYVWTVTNTRTSSTNTTTQDSDTFSWTPTAAGTYKVSCAVKEGNKTSTPVEYNETITVIADHYSAVANGSATITLTPGSSNNVKDVPQPLIKDTTTSTTTSTGVAYKSVAVKSGAAYVTLDTSTRKVTGVKTGTAVITATVTYKGADYTFDYTVSVKALDTTMDEVVNGGYDGYSFSELCSDVRTVVNNVYNTSVVSSTDTITLKIKTLPGTTAGTLKKGTSSTSTAYTTGSNVTSSDDVYFNAKEGFLGTSSFVVTATVGGTSYDVTFYVPVISDGTFTEEVEATEKTNGDWEYKVDFSNCEDLYIYTGNSFSNYEGYKNWTHKDDGNTVTVSKSSFNSNGECKFYVVSLDYYGVASTGTLTVTQVFNGIEYSGKIDEKIAFDENDFDEFIEDAAGITSKSKASVELVNVVFTKPSSSYVTLYDNGTKITDSKTKCTDLDKVYLTATKAGTYDLSFTANAKYYSGSTVTTGTAKEYKGVVRVTVYKDGDITYEVDANKSVTFNEDDFDKFYTKDTLSYVVFGTPSAGALYETSTCKTETKSTKFYFEATKSQDDLDTVTFKADKTPLTEYSVYIPFTAYAKNGTKSSEGVVEIIVNGSLPFTDVPESNTFYSYIKYCYRENIMQGKSTTLFKPTEPVTRAQLVVTLYRMANSPTTYNSNTMSFTDCKTLGTEFQNAIKWGVAKKLINGYGNTFKPNDSITRQAMVTILYRFGTNLGYIDGYGVTGSLNRFSDAAKISASMKDAVAWAVGAGLVSGNNGKFNPAGTTTRGACAKILAGFHETYVG